MSRSSKALRPGAIPLTTHSSVVSDLLGHHEALAVFAGQESVRFPVVDERLGLGIDGQPAADAVRCLVQGHLVLLQVLFHAGERLVGFLVVAERPGILAERLYLAQAVTDVAEVAQGARQVALENVGVQLLGLAAADGLDAVAVIPDPVPVVVQPLTMQGFHGGGAEPEIVVDGWGNGLVAGGFADAGAGLIAQAAGHLDLAELAGPEKVDGRADAVVAAALGAGLANALVLAGHLHHAPPFADIVPD